MSDANESAATVVAALLAGLLRGPAGAQQVTVPPALPAGLAIVSFDHASASLNWDDSGDGSITHYQLE